MQQSYFKSAYVRRSISINLKDLHNFTTNKINSTWHRHWCIRYGLRAPVSIIYDTCAYLKCYKYFQGFQYQSGLFIYFFHLIGVFTPFSREFHLYDGSGHCDVRKTGQRLEVAARPSLQAGEEGSMSCQQQRPTLGKVSMNYYRWLHLSV